MAGLQTMESDFRQCLPDFGSDTPWSNEHLSYMFPICHSMKIPEMGITSQHWNCTPPPRPYRATSRWDLTWRTIIPFAPHNLISYTLTTLKWFRCFRSPSNLPVNLNVKTHICIFPLHQGNRPTWVPIHVSLNIGSKIRREMDILCKRLKKFLGKS